MATVPMRPILPPEQVTSLIIQSRNIHLISYADLWERRYGGKD